MQFCAPRLCVLSLFISTIVLELIIRFKVYYLVAFLLRLAFADHDRYELFGFLMILDCITVSKVLSHLIPLDHVVELPLVPILLFDSSVNNEPSFLELLDSPNQIFVLEVTA